ncbi:hypothetical protein EPA93_35630 [Ktedonosporobacter rubrisoli]|uniref:Uncharacterized protein n=1 Tax=Ktedonosporobacter rubrisoli TaxID=2509675 RepID=A0A4P6K0S6_KTERU|nr:hypothetical protein [Ktedonosporobacter rubrisoli]QBD81016.1 hypothetical protein EPA93_35630 [Ktedonosporobacter rubrisoli]
MAQRLGLLASQALSEKTQTVLLELEQCIDELFVRASLQGYTEQVYTELLELASQASKHMKALQAGDQVTQDWIVQRDALSHEIESRMDREATEQ